MTLDLEVKWDGYRMMAYVRKGKIELRSRNNKNYTDRSKIIAEHLNKWEHKSGFEWRNNEGNCIIFIEAKTSSLNQNSSGKGTKSRPRI